MKVVDLVVLALATWRLASLLGQEDGPFGVLAALRYRMGERYDEYSNQVLERLGEKWYHALVYEIADQLTCLWCCSIWVGVLLTILYLVLPMITFYWMLPFALSAVGVYLNARARFRRR